MIDIDKLPHSVLDAIANNRDINLDDAVDRDRLKKWLDGITVEQAFNCYLTWNGLIGGWASQLIHALDGIRAASDERS